MLTAQDKEEKRILRAKLSKLGIASSPNSSLELLRAKLAEAEGNTELSTLAQEEVVETKPTATKAVESKADITNRVKKEATKLIRVRIKNLNPYKQDLHGEIFTVANEVIGKVSKYVPYDDAGDSYHIPNCIYKMLLSKKYLQVKTITDPVTKTRRVTQSWVPEFSIEILPQLTTEQLEELAFKQEAARKFEEV